MAHSHFFPVLSLTHNILELFNPSLSCCVSMLLWPLSLLLLWLCSALLLGLMYVSWFMYLYVEGSYEMLLCVESVLKKVTGVCVLLMAIWSIWYFSTVTEVPDMLCVPHDYSASFCHSHPVGLPSMVINVTFYIHSIHPRTPVFPLSGYCRSCRKNLESLLVSLFLMCASCFDFKAS